jgi:tetratricopeptide (TPR) repeat protein
MTPLVLVCALALVGFYQQPTNTAARLNRAVELQRQGALKEAAAEYRALLAENPNYIEALANLAGVLSRLGHYEESVDAYQRALKILPEMPQLLLNLGIAHHRAGQFERAAESLEKVVAKTPDSVQARQLLGISLVELGRDAEALPHLENTLSASSGDAASLYSLGLAYLRLGRPELSSIIDQLARTASGIAASHLLKGQALLAGHEYERSLAELEQAAKLSSTLPRLQYSIGLALLKLGRNKEAITAFESELARTPRDFSTLYYLAYLHEADGNTESAMERINAAMKIEAKSPEANALLGKLLVKQNKPAEALPPLEHAVKHDPNDPDKRYLLARVYQQMGRRDDAAREFAEVQRLKAEQLKGDRARTPKPQE